MSIVTQALGEYQTWTPTVTGFSSSTPTIATSKYTLIGKMCHVQFAMTATTSNATSFTITLPFTSKNLMLFAGGQAVDSGATQATPLVASLTAASNIATLYKTPALSAWTVSGNKGARFEFTYEIE